MLGFKKLSKTLRCPVLRLSGLLYQKQPRILFLCVRQILEDLEIKINLPITIRVDITETLFMSRHINTTSGTKHVDVRTKYFNNYCEDGVIKIICVESGDDDAAIMTKS